jgi:hypothetical protein
VAKPIHMMIWVLDEANSVDFQEKAFRLKMDYQQAGVFQIPAFEPASAIRPPLSSRLRRRRPLL